MVKFKCLLTLCRICIYVNCRLINAAPSLVILGGGQNLWEDGAGQKGNGVMSFCWLVKQRGHDFFLHAKQRGQNFFWSVKQRGHDFFIHSK